MIRWARTPYRAIRHAMANSASQAHASDSWYQCETLCGRRLDGAYASHPDTRPCKSCLRALAAGVEFQDHWTLVPWGVHDNQWAYEDTRAQRDLHNVWTVVTGDDGATLYAVPGYHIVNREFYVVTEEAWTDADNMITWKY
jgi:hypothetical protein